MKNRTVTFWVGLAAMAIGMGLQTRCIAQDQELQNGSLIEAAVKQAELPAVQGASKSGVRLFTFANLDAKEVQNTLQTIFRDSPMTFSVLKKQNTLVAQGPLETLDKVRELIRDMDADNRAPSNKRKTRVYRLSHANASSAETVLKSIFGETDRAEVLVVAEVTSNSLIVSSTEAQRDYVEQLIVELDTPIERPGKVGTAPENIVIRITWLVDSSEHDSELVSRLREPCKALEKLVDGLHASGIIQNSKSLTQSQTTIMVKSDGPSPNVFESSSLRQLGQKTASINAEGHVQSTDDGNYELELSLKLIDDSQKLNVVSTILIPKNHPVAFALADVGMFKSVVVVEIVDAQ